MWMGPIIWVAKDVAHGDGQHNSLRSHLEKFQGMCFEYEESVTWTGGMVPVLQPGGSSLETAEERCHLARVLIFTSWQLAKEYSPPPWTPRGGGVVIYCGTFSFRYEIHR